MSWSEPFNTNYFNTKNVDHLSISSIYEEIGKKIEDTHLETYNECLKILMSVDYDLNKEDSLNKDEPITIYI